MGPFFFRIAVKQAVNHRNMVKLGENQGGIIVKKTIGLLFLLIACIASSSFAAGLRLDVLSHPIGADVFVDQVWRGTTPAQIEINPGEHSVEVTKAGYISQTQRKEINLSTVMEFNLLPMNQITSRFPLVIYFENFRESGGRRILAQDEGQELKNQVRSRFESMGFSVQMEEPRAELDVVLDTQTVYQDVLSRYPNAGLILFMKGIWTFSTYQQKRLTRLELQTTVTSPETGITIANLSDLSESVGSMSETIVVWEIIEKVTQDFLDNIANYLVSLSKINQKNPVLISARSQPDASYYLVKHLNSVQTAQLLNSQGSVVSQSPISIEGFPLNVLFLVDRSSSTERRAEAVKNQIEAFLGALPAGARWAIMGFDDKIELVQGYTSDPSRWASAQMGIFSSGMTRLYDGLFNAAVIAGRESGINVIVLLTDGIDANYYDTGPGSTRTKSDALVALKDAGVILYPVATHQHSYQNFLKELGTLFCTPFFNLATLSDPESIATQILEDLQTTALMFKGPRVSQPRFKLDLMVYQQGSDQRTLLPESSSLPQFATPPTQPVEVPVTSPTPVSTVPTQPEETAVATVVVEEVTPVATVATEPPTQPEPKEGPEEPVTVSPVPSTTVEEPTPVATVVESPSPTIPPTPPATEVSTPPTQETTTVLLPPEPEKVKQVDIPAEFSETLQLQYAQTYDLDRSGNFAWTEESLLYLWVKEENRLLGVDLEVRPSRIQLEFPFLAIEKGNTLEVLEVLSDRVVRKSSILIRKPISSFALGLDLFLFLAYEDNTLEIFDLDGDLTHQFTVLHGAVSDMVMDNQLRLLFQSGSNYVGWMDIPGKTEPSYVKFEKPLVSLSPFNIDSSRFLAVDAGGAVHYQRFDPNISPTSRNLNRGILLQAMVAEEKNLLLTVHWDKKIRAFRIYDLKEMYNISSSVGIEDFAVDALENTIVFVDGDQVVYLLTRDNRSIPTFIEKIYSPVEPESTRNATEQGSSSATQASLSQPEISTQPEPDVVPTQEEQPPVSTASPVSSIQIPDTTGTTSIPPRVSSPSPVVDPSVQPTMEAVFGSWEKGVAYQDRGFLLAGEGHLTMFNSLLEQTFDIVLNPGEIRWMDISRFGQLALLLDKRIEVFDVRFMMENARNKWPSGFKYPIEGAKQVAFSKNGKRMLLNFGGGELQILDLDFQKIVSLSTTSNVLCIAGDQSGHESFVAGDEKGNLIFIRDDTVMDRKNVSNAPITQVIWFAERVFWGDASGNVGSDTGRPVKVSESAITSIYAADFEKDWVLFGTEAGQLLIYSTSLEKVAVVDLENPVRWLAGWNEFMLSINENGSIRSWNLQLGSPLATNLSLAGSMGFLSDGQNLSFVKKDGSFLTLDPQTGKTRSKKLYEASVSIDVLFKYPALIRIKDHFFSIKEGSLGEKTLKVLDPNGVSVAEKYCISWKDDYVNIYDVLKEESIRTFQFGKTIDWGTMVNDRLLFFFNDSFGLTNPFKPSELLVMDVPDAESLHPILSFIFQDRMLIASSNGQVYPYYLLTETMGMPIPVSSHFQKAYYNASRLVLIAFSGNKVYRYYPMDNNILIDTVPSQILDVDWTSSSFYALTEEGILWKKDF